MTNGVYFLSISDFFYRKLSQNEIVFNIHMPWIWIFNHSKCLKLDLSKKNGVLLSKLPAPSAIRHSRFGFCTDLVGAMCTWVMLVGCVGCLEGSFYWRRLEWICKTSDWWIKKFWFTHVILNIYIYILLFMFIYTISKLISWYHNETLNRSIKLDFFFVLSLIWWISFDLPGNLVVCGKSGLYQLMYPLDLFMIPLKFDFFLPFSSAPGICWFLLGKKPPCSNSMFNFLGYTPSKQKKVKLDSQGKGCDSKHPLSPMTEVGQWRENPQIKKTFQLQKKRIWDDIGFNI